MTTPDFRERLYVSRYATDVLGLSVHKDGLPADVDGDIVMVTLVSDTNGTVALSRLATHEGIGLYETRLTAEESSTVGPYSVHWTYDLDGSPEQYTTYLQVGEVAPDYDRLTPGLKEVVDSVYIRFADLFDSPTGGPNLQTYFQSHFGRQRIAQLLRIASGRLNTMAQPSATFTVDGPTPSFPLAQWGSLLETSLYLEVLRHLVRSYVEQPAFIGGNVTRLDRRDYMDRWQSVLRDEEDIFKGQLDVFKISMMGLGKPKVLVSGGVYGRYGPTRFAGSVAARPRYYARFYTVILLTVGLSASSLGTWHEHGSATRPSTSGSVSTSQGA